MMGAMETTAPNTTVLRRMAVSARARLGLGTSAPVTAAAEPAAPATVAPALAQLREQEATAYREMTRAFAQERGLDYIPAFNLGYNSWPEADQLDFDALAGAFTAEWTAKKAALEL